MSNVGFGVSGMGRTTELVIDITINVEHEGSILIIFILRIGCLEMMIVGDGTRVGIQLARAGRVGGAGSTLINCDTP